MDLNDGGKVELSTYRGSKIVILDFWATWCRPCRQAMEDMESLAKSVKDKPVECLAVNLMEAPDLVRRYLKDHDAGVPVALDPQGLTGEGYLVEAIPTIVVIGYEGTIQAVHVGEDRWLKRRLAAEVDDLLHGGQPAAPEAKEFTAGDRLRYRLGLPADQYCAVFVGY